jgi:kumamolisin
MTRLIVASAVTLGLVLASGASRADNIVLGKVPGGTLLLPESSVVRPEDAGIRAHTNTMIFVPDAQPKGKVRPGNAPPYPDFLIETPSSIACIYKLVNQGSGCEPDLFHTNSSGGSKVIAIVDAYDAPKVRQDLTTFSTQFGLPAPTTSNFQVVYASGHKPAYNSDWEGEISLDTQIVHGIAPNAKIILVEAASSSNADLLQAEDVASQMVNAAGGGEVTNSWGGSEFSSETSDDAHFEMNKVVYFASTGDNPGTEYPSVSTQVIAVGGTTIVRASNTSFFQTETAWSSTNGDTDESTGGGKSRYISRPSFQSAVSGVVGSSRGVPDISADADPVSGVWIHIQNQNVCGPKSLWDHWCAWGGTSLASPLVASIVNNAGSFAANSDAELTKIYGNRSLAADYFDVTQGKCGPHRSLSTLTGYDLCTGVGTPRGLGGK